MYTKIKNEKIESLSFIKHAVITDGNIKSLEIETKDGIFLVSFEYYGSGLTISEPKPDVFEKRYVLTGKVAGVPITEARVKTKEHAEALQRSLGDGVSIEEREINITKNPDIQVSEDFDGVPF